MEFVAFKLMKNGMKAFSVTLRRFGEIQHSVRDK